MASQHNQPKDAEQKNARADGGPHAENIAAQQGRHGYLGDDVPGLVPPSKLNQGDTGAASDQPQGNGELNFDDDAMGERVNNVRSGGTWAAHGADSAPLGPPAEIFSDTNAPSDRGGKTSGNTGKA